MTPSPTSCLKCGHQFPPHTPEPSWCPDCGRLCSGFDVQDEPPELVPDEIPETPQEQRRLRVWFWAFFLAGPVVAGFSAAFRSQSVSLLPGWLQSMATAGGDFWLALVAGAVGAGFCLARLLYPRRPFSTQLVVAFGLGMTLLMGYLVVVATVFRLLSVLVYKVIK